MLIRRDAAGHIHHHLHAFKQLALELIALANNQLDVCSAFSQNKLYFLFSRLPRQIVATQRCILHHLEAILQSRSSIAALVGTSLALKHIPTIPIQP
jgi:hypothetical protein